MRACKGRQRSDRGARGIRRRRHDRAPELNASPGRPARLGRLKLIGLGFVFLWFLIGGIAHFAATDLEMRIVPPYIPWRHATVLGSGVLELLGAAALLYRATRRAAGLGLVVLTIAVTPANIYMLQRADLFAVPHWALLLRLPLQVALVALIWWSTTPPTSQAARRRDL
jgi:uncharacterized membrane protein